MTGQAINRETFERIVLENLPVLHAYARRLTKGRSTDDLVQDTVLKALRSLGQYRAGTNFKAWIFKIMTNHYIDNYRKRDRMPSEVPIDEVFGLESRREPGTALDDVATVTDPAALARVLPDPLLRALDALPETHRETVLLRDLGGFAYKEIADILECPIGTVMSRLHYSRNELKKTLQSHARAEGFLPESEES